MYVASSSEKVVFQKMSSHHRDRTLMAVIGDEDSVTGLLLAGIGHTDTKQQSNFMVVDASNDF
jgi:V-type H+-transporting ATPase subunit F